MHPKTNHLSLIIQNQICLNLHLTLLQNSSKFSVQQITVILGLTEEQNNPQTSTSQHEYKQQALKMHLKKTSPHTARDLSKWQINISRP